MRVRLGSVAAVMLIMVALAGCRSGSAVGDGAWLDYEGQHKDVVSECVAAVPPTIKAPTNNFPEAAEYANVVIDETVIDDQRSTFDVEGTVNLVYGGEPDIQYRWGCHVSQRLTVLRVTDVHSEILDHQRDE